MDATTIRISKKDKNELDQLGMYLSFKSKKRFTHAEILSLLISIGKEKVDEILEKITYENEKLLSENDIENDSFFNLPTINLDENASESIDKTIYKSNGRVP